MARVQDIAAAIEKTAPLNFQDDFDKLNFQDDFDNSGLQAGFPSAEVGKVLVCLDVTEAVVQEAASLGCGLIVSHHPLLFHALKQVSDATYQQRCAVAAIRAGIAIYSAHTSLDNAPGGVNHRIASLIGLTGLRWLSPRPDGLSGSGLVGELPSPVSAADFFAALKEKFGVSCLMHSPADGRSVSRVALCGGAGAFLLPDAIAAGADCFVCGEFHYHDYFENKAMLLAELGHYQSEQFTMDLLAELIGAAFPELEVIRTSINTNPIQYDCK